MTADVVVIGAGVAGLAFALSAPESLRVTLLTKGKLGESNTRWAQGGLSAAIGTDDTIELHETDTLFAGAGLSEPEAVHELVAGGPEAVEWLLSIGTAFDRDEVTGQLALGREAAHSRRRVLHAGGDATGAEIERALVAAVRLRPNVRLLESSFAVDLLVEEDRCTGVVVGLADGSIVRILAGGVVLAAGGAGQLWATTSNPPAATADGLAMAIRAGVVVADLEFCQFHPTVLKMSGGSPFLISEAVRGEGAWLRDRAGNRFMVAEHELAELAPRDVVARGIQKQMVEDGLDHAYLDLRHLDPETMRRRFPTIARELASRGLDLATDLIPVAPAAHYFMGGVVADELGETSMPGLLAVGEAACTGVHGANRLASNSLLEGLVFGRRAGLNFTPFSQVAQPPAPDNGDVHDWHRDESYGALLVRRSIQATMSRFVSVVRDARGLGEAIAILTTALDAMPRESSKLDDWVDRNMALASLAVASAAVRREESRGAHFRSDFVAADASLEGVHFALRTRPGDDDLWVAGSLDLARARVAT
jgi:L-aspartate oxidase